MIRSSDRKNKIHNRKTIERRNKIKNRFFGKINKICKTLTRLKKKRKDSKFTTKEETVQLLPQKYIESYRLGAIICQQIT